MTFELPPDRLRAFAESAPEEVAQSLTVLSAAVSLTDEVAVELLHDCSTVKYRPADILNCVRLCDFIIERNSEWHIEPSVREYLLGQLHREPELTKSVHAVLRRIATEADPAAAGTTIPTYLTWQVGQAYHTTVFDPDIGLRLYSHAFTGQSSGDQWLLGVLAEEQQVDGFLPPHAIEPAFFQGMTAYREGRWETAESYFRRVIDSKQERKEVGTAYHLLGRIAYRQRHRSEEAERLLRVSLDISEKIGDLVLLGMVLHSLANVIARKDPVEAERLLRRSLNIEEKLKNLDGQAQVLHTLANIIKVGDPVEAEKLLRRSLTLGERIGNLHHQAQLLQSLAILLGRRNLREAESLLRRSLTLSEQMHDLHGQSQALHSLANLLERSDPEQTERLLWQSLKISERLRNLFSEAQVLHSIANIIKTRDRAQAEKLLRRSLDIGQKIGNLRHQAQVLQSLSILISKNNPREAESLLQRSLKLNEQMDDLFGQVQVMNTLANLIRPTQARRAEQLLRRSVDLAGRIGNMGLQASSLQSLAMLIGTANLKESQDLMQRSIDISKQAGDVYREAQGISTLANILRRAGKWQAARNYYTQSLALSSYPKNLAVVHLGLSYVEENTNNLTAAIEHMKQAIIFQRRTDRPDLVSKHEARLRQLQKRLADAR